MTTLRKVIAGASAIINASIATGVCFQWHEQGCGIESLIAAIAFYGVLGFGLWFAIDQTIKESNA